MHIGMNNSVMQVPCSLCLHVSFWCELRFAATLSVYCTAERDVVHITFPTLLLLLYLPRVSTCFGSAAADSCGCCLHSAVAGVAFEMPLHVIVEPA